MTELQDAEKTELAQVIVGADPAAVLLVDLKTRTIVYANAVANQLAPGVGLPAGLDEWSDVAALRDVNGDELSDTNHPLSAIAESKPVIGQAISAARKTELGPRRDPLWVVALPLSDTPQLEGQALVVMLPLAAREQAQAAAAAAQTQADLRDQAIFATGMAFTMADAQAADRPLIWVNPAFTTTTGYSFEEAVGKNCRFLQGKLTDPEAPKEMRRALDAGESISTTVLNYRKNGTAFWNHVAMSPIHDAAGTLTHFVGIQTDVTGRVDADLQRDQALAEAQSARDEAERSQKQLTLMVEATSQLIETLDVDESLSRLSTIVVPLLADWVIIVTAERNGSVSKVIVRHRDGRPDVVDAYTEHLKNGFEPGSIFEKLFDGAPAQMFNDYGTDERRATRETWVSDKQSLDISDNLGTKSVMFVPLPGRNHVDGVMILARGQNSPAYNEQDLAVATDLGRRAGLILDNARLYQSEHHIAETLQRSLLPEIPDIEGVCAAARYRAGEIGAAVGGDFYELIRLRNGAIGMAIGDVVGHDVLAAAAMGHLRGLLRACAWDSPSNLSPVPTLQDPADVLDRVDELMLGLSITTIASVAYANFEPLGDGNWQMRHSSAGHPPMMVRHPDGKVEVLDETHGLLLGVQTDKQRNSAGRILAPGTTIVAYTDGLVERRDEALTAGFERLAEVISAGPSRPSELCDLLLSSFASDTDDVAILVLQL